MTKDEVVEELRALGSESTKRTLMKHGAKEPFFGVKIEDMKKIQKRVKKDYALSLELYDTGISDAMYLAGLIADDEKMTKKDLQRWVEKAYWHMLSEYTVPWVAAEGRYGREMGLKWIEAKKETIAAAGWATLSSLVSITDDADLDLEELTALVERVRDTIHAQPNRVRYAMNGFLLAVGGYVPALTELVTDAADAVGTVTVDMNGTSCKVPEVPEYLAKMKARGNIGKKRKSAKC